MPTKIETVVWIANEAGHPYYKIRDVLGDDVAIKPLSLGDINPLRPDRISWHMASGIAKLVKPDDVLLISGSPLVNAIALTLWMQVHRRCRLAIWDAKAGRYIIATMELENLLRILQEQVEG